MSINIAGLLPSSFPTRTAPRLVVVSAEAPPDEVARLDIAAPNVLIAFDAAPTPIMRFRAPPEPWPGPVRPARAPASTGRALFQEAANRWTARPFQPLPARARTDTADETRGFCTPCERTRDPAWQARRPLRSTRHSAAKADWQKLRLRTQGSGAPSA